MRVGIRGRLRDRAKQARPVQFGLPPHLGMWSSEETFDHDFTTYVERFLKGNLPVAACAWARADVFSQARFAWYRIRDGVVQDSSFSTPALDLLHHPWPGAGTETFLARAELEGSFAGNSYWVVIDHAGQRQLKRLDPTKVWIITGGMVDGQLTTLHPDMVDAVLIGYRYDQPNGESVYFSADQVCHYAPKPDPAKSYVGMSWITPAIDDIIGDTDAAKHKRAFFRNSATPQFVVSFKEDIADDAFDRFVNNYRKKHEGSRNAYKTLFFTHGADIRPLTVDMRQLEFSQTQGKGESRIAAAAGVPSAWAGFSEGMQGTGLNQGNMAQMRRRFADGTIRPAWSRMTSSLRTLVESPGNDVLLGVDTTNVAFLREDEAERAETFRTKMRAIDTAIKAGYYADAAVRAADTYRVNELQGQHSNLFSVQMQPVQQISEGGTDED